MSAKCQKRTSHSLDHVVGDGEQLRQDMAYRIIETSVFNNCAGGASRARRPPS